MSDSAVRPEDTLPDDADTIDMHGVKNMRKGTVVAVLANASILESATASPEQKQNALATIKEFAPTLVALGFREHLVWKNNAIQDIIDNVTL